MLRSATLLGIAATAACGTYRENRAALVPRAVPQLHSGMPLDGVAEASLGLASVGHSTDLGVGDPDAGVEVPGTQVHGDMRLRLSDAFALGLVYENGLDYGAKGPEDHPQPPIDEGNVQGVGVTADVSIRTRDPRLRVGLGFDVIVWRVPYVEYQACATPDPFDCWPDNFVESGTDDTETFGFSVMPSYRTGDVTWFGGVTARQHPTIEQKGTEMELFEGEGDVESGPFNMLISAGLEAGLAGGAVKATAILYQDVTQDPVKYGPGMALLVSVPIGRRTSAPTATQDAMPPPAYPPPAPYPPAAPPPPAPPPAPAPPPPTDPAPSPYMSFSP